MEPRSRSTQYAAWGIYLQRFRPSFRFKSIIGRIIFLHVIAVGIICILMPLLLYWLLARETDSLQRVALREHADMLAGNLKQNPKGDWTLDLPQNVKALYSDTYGRYAYAIVDDTGHAVLSSLRDNALIFSPASDQSSASAQQETHGDAVLSGISVSKQIGDKTVSIQVAENLRHRDVIIDDIVANFMQRVGWITLPILMTLLVIDILIFRRVLRPLMRASREARRIGPSRTDVRLPTSGMPSEVLILVQAVNQAFDRLEQGFRAQREFAADAAHELRTPLAILRARVDTSPETSISEAVRKDIERMSRVVNQLLDMAELDTSVMEPCEETDLQSVCADVVEYIAPLALREGKEIALCSCEGPVHVKGNRVMLFRALRNLAENAISHSTEGSTVEIVLEADGTISVLDKGPGIREEDREFIFRRFWRGDRRQFGSVGLGLSIVERIAEAHAGTISVRNRPEGGAHFSLRLSPIRPASAASNLQPYKAQSPQDGQSGYKP
jgi:signal transduction histidine kinase